MPKCNFCDREVQEIGQREIDQGWARVVIGYYNHKGQALPIKEETIVHCPDHLQQAFDMMIKKVAKVHKYNIGIRLKESIPLCNLVVSHLVKTCRRPEPRGEYEQKDRTDPENSRNDLAGENSPEKNAGDKNEQAPGPGCPFPSPNK